MPAYLKKYNFIALYYQSVVWTKRTGIQLVLKLLLRMFSFLLLGVLGSYLLILSNSCEQYRSTKKWQDSDFAYSTMLFCLVNLKQNESLSCTYCSKC